MASLEQTFSETCAGLRNLGEEAEALRVTLVEDRPLSGAVMLIEELGHAAEDLCGWLTEALSAALEACGAVAPRCDCDTRGTR